MKQVLSSFILFPFCIFYNLNYLPFKKFKLTKLVSTFLNVLFADEKVKTCCSKKIPKVVKRYGGFNLLKH